MENNGTAEKNYRWNFSMGLVHGIFFSFGMAFSDPYAVLPLFLGVFTQSKMLIGLMSSIIQSGSSLPQLFVAKKMRHLPSGKPILLLALWIRWLSWGTLAGIILLWGDRNPVLTLGAFVLILTIFSVGGGIAGIPFNQMISKSIPAEKRGNFWGQRQFWGGLLAIGAGYLVKQILSSESLVFPDNYGLLFLITFFTLTFAFLGLSFFREDASDVAKNMDSGSILKLSWHHFKNYKPLRLVIGTTILSRGLFISLPFFVLYAGEKLTIPAGGAGYFISAQMGGAILSNLVWSRLSDRIGSVIVIRWTTIFAALAVVVALSVQNFWLYTLVFGFSGFYLSGAGIGFNNYILEIGIPEVRTLFLSIHGTLIFPIYFFPLLGGLLVDFFGYPILFFFTFLLILTGLLLSFFLCEPRKGDARCEIGYPIDL